MLLSLDINSRATGFAFGDEKSSCPRGGTWSTPGCADDDRMNRTLAALYNSISELSKVIHPQIVLFEAPFNPQAKEKGETTHQTVVNLFRLEAVARTAGVNTGARIVKPIAVQTWRKTFTGHGRPENPKEATQARCRLLGWKYGSEDEADAIGLWAHGMSVYFPRWAPKATPLFSEAQGRT